MKSINVNDFMREYVPNRIMCDKIGNFVISTVAIKNFGYDNFNFETMVFRIDKNNNVDFSRAVYSDRYIDKEKAVTEHIRIYEKFKIINKKGVGKI